MTYIPNNWVDQKVERQKTYEVTNNSDGSITLIDSFGLVTELGTPVNADNMNKIEEGIARCDVRKYDIMEIFNKNEWVTGVLNDTKDLYESITDNNIGNALTDTTKWKKVELGGGNTLPIFTQIYSDRVLTGPEAIGFALAGSLVTRTYPQAVENVLSAYNEGTETTYRGVVCKRGADGRFIADISQKDAVNELYASSGVAEFYVLDSANEQFYLPRNDWFVQGTGDISRVNQFVEAGVPNVLSISNAAKTEAWAKLPPYATDAVNKDGYMLQVGTSSTTVNTHHYVLNDASLSNPTYGKSETVQPPSSLKLVYYKVGNTVVNESLVDVGNVLSELQLKADNDLGNINSEGKSFASGMGMPSGVKIYNILGAPGSSVPSRNYQTGVGSKLKYTPLANGYIGVSITARVYDNGVSQGIVVTANDLVTVFAHFQYNFHTDSFYFPVKKGETYTFYISYQTGGNSTSGLLNESYFEYAQGEIS